MWWISGTIRSRPEHVLACETGRLRRQLRKVNLVAIDIPGREHVWRDGASVFGARYCKLRLWRSDEIFGKQLCSLQRLWSSGTFGSKSFLRPPETPAVHAGCAHRAPLYPIDCAATPKYTFKLHDLTSAAIERALAPVVTIGSVIS